jgi:hypothetical protein
MVGPPFKFVKNLKEVPFMFDIILRIIVFSAVIFFVVFLIISIIKSNKK